MTQLKFENIYGAPADDLVGDCTDAVQYSPLVPGARALEDVAPGSLDNFAMAAPPGTLERRCALALALRALKPGGRLVAVAPKDKGGSRLAQDLKLLGCASEESARSHHRICATCAPGDANVIAAAIEQGAPRLIEPLGLWSQPGVFSWDKIDAGSALLAEQLPTLSGRGADFGCGIGVLARKILASPKVSELTLIDIDRRAIALARRNIDDARAKFLWADARALDTLTGLDFVVTNPPFHEGGIESKALGQSFIQRAAAALRNGGSCWLVANRHLPYEKVLKPLFRRVTPLGEAAGYKIFQAQK